MIVIHDYVCGTRQTIVWAMLKRLFTKLNLQQRNYAGDTLTEYVGF